MFFNKFKTSAPRAIILINLTYFKMDHGHRRNELPSMEMVKATQLTLGAMCMIEPVDNDACCAFVCCPPIGTKCKRIYGDSLIPPGLQNYMDQTEFESMCDDIDKAYASTSAPIVPCVMLHFPGVIYLLCLISSRKNKMNEIVNRVNALPALTRNGMSWKATACGPDTDSSNFVNPMCQRYIFSLHSANFAVKTPQQQMLEMQAQMATMQRQLDVQQQQGGIQMVPVPTMAYSSQPAPVYGTVAPTAPAFEKL